MNFKITNGKGLISIEYDVHRHGECLSIGNEPATFLWREYDDPDEDNLALLSIKKENKTLINDVLKDIDFEIDYTDKIDDLFQALQPLLHLLQNGNYELEFLKEKSFNVYLDAALFGEERMDSEDVEEEIRKYQENLHQHIIQNDHSHRDNTYCYRIYEYPFIAWKSEQEMDNDIVAEYEQQLSAGARPFAIILTGKYAKDDYFHDHVLDGHHKLRAYKNLKIEPLIAVINFLPKEESEVRNIDMERLVQSIYPWQLNHYFSIWSEYGMKHYLDAHPDSLVKKYIKNGFFTSFHHDGSKCVEVSYIDDVNDGEYKYWDRSGKLYIQGCYSLGKRIGKWVYYSTLHDVSSQSSEVNDVFLRDEYIYKDGKVLVHKSWNEEGKIRYIGYTPHTSPIEFHLSEEMILKYSTEEYEKVLKRKDMEEQNRISEKKKQEVNFARIKKDERVYMGLKVLLLMVVIVLIIIYFNAF